MMDENEEQFPNAEEMPGVNSELIYTSLCVDENNLYLTGSGDMLVRQVDRKTGALKKMHRVENRQDEVLDAFMLGGQLWLLTSHEIICADDSKTRCDIKRGKLVPSCMAAVTLSRVFVAHESKTLTIGVWDLKSQRLTVLLENPTFTYLPLYLHAVHDTLFLSARDAAKGMPAPGRVVQLDSHTGCLLREFQQACISPGSLCWFQGLLLVTALDDRLLVFDPDTGKLITWHDITNLRPGIAIYDNEIYLSRQSLQGNVKAMKLCYGQ